MTILKSLKLDKSEIIEKAKSGAIDFLSEYRQKNELRNPVWLRMYSVPPSEEGIIEMLGIESDIVTLEFEREGMYKLRNLEKFDFDNIDSKIKGTLNLIVKGGNNPLFNMLLSDLPEIENIKKMIPDVAENLRKLIPDNTINLVIPRNKNLYYVQFEKKGEFVGKLIKEQILNIEI